MAVVALVCAFAPFIGVNGQNVVDYEQYWNVTFGGELVSEAAAVLYGVQYRSFQSARHTGLLGVATSSVALDSSVNLASAALGATYVRAAVNGSAHLPLCALAYYVNDTGACWYVPDPPVENFNPLYAVSMLASFPLALHEVTPSGAVYASIPFASLKWAVTPLAPSPSAAKSLALVQWTANVTTSTQVSVTFMQSGVLGVVDYERTTVIPKVWRALVQVVGYNLNSNQNALSLEVATVMGPGAKQEDSGLLIHRHNQSPKRSSHGMNSMTAMNAYREESTYGERSKTQFGSAYCHLLPTFVELKGGNTYTAYPSNFTIKQGANVAFASILDEQMQTRYGHYYVWSANVTFPKGYSSLLYNYSTGIGAILHNVSMAATNGSDYLSTGNASDASSLATSILLLLIASLSLAFAL